jgi:hypothetical protein
VKLLLKALRVLSSPFRAHWYVECYRLDTDEPVDPYWDRLVLAYRTRRGAVELARQLTTVRCTNSSLLGYRVKSL